MQRGDIGLGEYFFEPDHMIAPIELEGTSMESTHYGIAHFFMELYAVKGEILVFLFGIGDAGIEVCYMLCRKELFKGGVEFCTYAFAVKSFFLHKL